jgi:hypothetical protein
MKCYLVSYFFMAFRQIGDPRDFQMLTPFQLLSAMHSFWLQTFGPQDTIVVCLEVQQRFLFANLKQRLQQSIRDLKAVDCTNLDLVHRSMLAELTDKIMHGLVYKKSDELDRIFFLDIVARTLILQGCFRQMQEKFDTAVGLLYSESLIADMQLDVDFMDSTNYFGNIDHEDQSELTDSLLQSFTEKFFLQIGDALPRSCLQYLQLDEGQRALCDQIVSENEKKFKIQPDQQAYRFEQRPDHGVEIDPAAA